MTLVVAYPLLYIYTLPVMYLYEFEIILMCDFFLFHFYSPIHIIRGDLIGPHLVLSCPK